ncbi:TIR domain-containing protein [Granulicella tundricola]|uniref:TIR domain-containing protein n=1 Tax=Granulicella tundricola (strain ATCC BAA-1859 / DSM 23138 / MP5ACTX9) TaxID=1198114 RepID=E8X331_GRATM|nr:hypothetical protein [Granulicella tundricola]ADW69255.1 hypothetical protein AciX9_2211 [Granulicella tundricola MP5ACTX9]
MSTKILMSFAMANQGAAFANWLRDKLMKHYSLYAVDDVYMDSVVARSGNTRHATFREDFVGDAPAGTASVTPDRRDHMRSPTGAMPIGAARADWNTLYKNAMREAQIMLFVYTEEYNDSVYCMQELGQFHMENGRRRRAHLPILRGVVLQFNPGNLFGMNQTHVTRIPVTRTNGMRMGLAWDHGDFILSPPHLQLLTTTLGPLI